MIFAALHETAFGTKRTCRGWSRVSALRGKADRRSVGYAALWVEGLDEANGGPAVRLRETDDKHRLPC